VPPAISCGPVRAASRGIHLHHGEGQGDRHGGVKTAPARDEDKQDARQKQSLNMAFGHLGTPGPDPRRGNQLAALDPAFLDRSVRRVPDLHRGPAAVFQDHGRPIAGLGPQRQVEPRTLAHEQGRAHPRTQPDLLP
jgi:hypothetical protein